MINTALSIKNDCTILLERALLSKFICAFGEDGLGLYGKNNQTSCFNIKSVEVNISEFANDAEISGTVEICLDGYDSNTSGHIMTDKIFEIGIALLLKAVSINPAALVWQRDASNQGVSTVVMDINLDVLAGWK